MPALAPVNVTLFGKVSGPRDDVSWVIGADPESNVGSHYKRKAEGKFGSDRRGDTGRRVHVRMQAETGGAGHKPMNTWSHGGWKRQGGSLPWTLLGQGTPQSLDCWAPEL